MGIGQEPQVPSGHMVLGHVADAKSMYFPRYDDAIHKLCRVKQAHCFPANALKEPNHTFLTSGHLLFIIL